MPLNIFLFYRYKINWYTIPLSTKRSIDSNKYNVISCLIEIDTNTVFFFNLKQITPLVRVYAVLVEHCDS